MNSCTSTARGMPPRSRARLRVGHDDDAARRVGSFAAISARRGDDVDRLAVVEVAVGGEQHLGLDLAEAVEHALHAEIGRARRPDRAEARRRQHRDRPPRACWAGSRRRGRPARRPRRAAPARAATPPRRARRSVTRALHPVLAPEHDARCRGRAGAAGSRRS